MNEKSPTVTPFLSDKEVELLKRNMLSKFPEDQQETFIRVCQRTKLDPFTKQIYPTQRYQKIRDADSGQTRKVPTLVTVTGIMGLCAIAERTGNYDGCVMAWAGKDGVWRDAWLSDQYPEAARCTVYHKGRTHPEVAIARWGGFAGTAYNYETKTWEITDFWAKMPDYMLGKCAKAAALRGAFPDQLSNVYIREELDSDLTDSEETEQIPSDEAKYAESRAREAKDRLEHPDQYVTSGPAQQTPTQATEPAFEEDKVPPKPVAPPAAAPLAGAAAAVPEAVQPPADDLDMGPLPPPEPPWKAHQILGLRHVKYYKKAIGELTKPELTVLEEQWIPAVRNKWTEASDEQKKDVNMLEAALAYHKAEKPW
jgi:phage recombination protein Bet